MYTCTVTSKPVRNMCTNVHWTFLINPIAKAKCHQKGNHTDGHYNNWHCLLSSSQGPSKCLFKLQHCRSTSFLFDLIARVRVNSIWNVVKNMLKIWRSETLKFTATSKMDSITINNETRYSFEWFCYERYWSVGRWSGGHSCIYYCCL